MGWEHVPVQHEEAALSCECQVVNGETQPFRCKGRLDNAGVARGFGTCGGVYVIGYRCAVHGNERRLHRRQVNQTTPAVEKAQQLCSARANLRCIEQREAATVGTMENTGARLLLPDALICPRRWALNAPDRSVLHLHHKA